MRTIVGAIAVLGLAAAVAGAQPPRERGATFRPPEPLQPGELPLVARGASEELPPSFPSSTPVSRPDNRAPSGRGPAWLSGTDPGVQPAGGTLSRGGRAPASAPPGPNAKRTAAAMVPEMAADAPMSGAMASRLAR